MTQQYCTACGKGIPAEAKFCPGCGAAVQTRAAEGAARKGTARKTTKQSAGRDAAIIVGVLALATAGYFVFRSPVAPPEPPQQQAQTQGHADVPGGPMGGSMAGLENLPTDFNGLVQMGNQTMDAGNFAVAAESYRRALAINPMDVNVRTDFGACLHSMGLPDRAMEEFQTVLKQDPSHSIAQFNMGIVYLDKGQEDSARVYWERYLQADPNGPAAAKARELLANLKG